MYLNKETHKIHCGIKSLENKIVIMETELTIPLESENELISKSTAFRTIKNDHNIITIPNTVES